MRPRFSQEVNESARTVGSAQAKFGAFSIDDESCSGQVDLHLSLRSALVGVSIETGSIRVIFALGDGRSVGNRIESDER